MFRRLLLKGSSKRLKIKSCYAVVIMDNVILMMTIIVINMSILDSLIVCTTHKLIFLCEIDILF